MTRGKRIYVLDTNVLMHDPTALFKFEEHDVFLPMQVIEELDNAKKGTSEVSRNARQVSRFLDELLENTNAEQIQAGILLSHPQGIQLKGQAAIGRLFFQIKPIDPGRTFGEMLPDNKILASVLALREENADVPVILVSKDINLRIKAYISGLVAEDYQNDRALDDFSLLFTGAIELPEDFWQKHNEDLRSWNERGRTHYEIVLAEDEDWYPNQYLYLPGEDEVELRVAKVGGGKATLCLVDDFRSGQHAVWGIVARNREQNFALNALMDPEIDFVTLLGTAGTGKTLLALAAGLAQTMDQQRYREIIMTRATVSVGEDIGFLPGTEEEKMTPWMGALTDNLEVLTHNQEGGSWGRAATNDLLASRIKIRSMNFMRGRTFLSRYLILDEAQNLTPKQMKTLITRAGPGTKIVCLGNVEQIDTPYLTETTSGLTYAVDRFKAWPHSAHITLRRGERSRLADFASEVLWCAPIAARWRSP
ncbi:phosphate starvation-inducible protein PhoH [Xanthomonas perforans]|nr:PhoH family protein [Xanthomonas perforans]RXD34751.1 phosphate starvation-inducible protein PhoH [Xanthomonas perforans]